MTRTFLALLALLTLLSPAARADNQVVNDCSDNGLRTAVAQAQSTGGGTISFTCGPATIVLQNGTLPTITTNTTVEGGGTITISGNNTTVAFQMAGSGATLTLNNLTITQCMNPNGDGGAIRNGSSSSAGTINITNCKFLGNTTTSSFSGGAILTYGPLNITNSEFANNKGGGGGAVYPRFSKAVTTINGCNFHDNAAISTTAGWGGAMLFWDGPPVTVTNTTFVNNTALRGGAVFVTGNSSLTLTDSVVTSNSAANPTGGGLDISGVATISNTQITSNKAPGGGAGINTEAGAQVEIINSTISGNTSRGYAYQFGDINKVYGAGIRSLGKLTISGSTISDNIANVGNMGSVGGGIYHETGALALTNVTIQGNHAIHGGGVWIQSGNGTMSGVTFNKNLADSGDGGGLRNNGILSVSGATFTGNYAVFSGGGISNTGTLTLTNSTLSTNGAYNGGGGLVNYGTATLNNSTLSNNNAAGGGTGNGGGAQNNGTLTLNSVIVDGNSANCDGGGIHNTGSLILNASTVANNTSNGGDEVSGPVHGGGGIFNSNGATLSNSTVSGNKTIKGDGGGMSNYHGVALVGNCTFSGNTAAGWGGGLISDYAQTVLNHVTLSGNGAAAGGGIYNLTADSTRTITLSSTVIANSPSGYNCAEFTGSKDLQSYGYNVSDDSSFNTFCSVQAQPGDRNNADAKLGPLANNGGNTLTHLPQPGSAVVDAIPNGTNGCGTMVNPDQRGVARPQGPACDVGSVEVQPIDYVTPTPTPTPTSTPTATPTPKPATLANISTRLRVETGDNALIGGFIITGTQPKKVIIRAIGPSLPFAGALADPTLELYQGDTLLESNDNWVDSPNKQAIIDSTIPPSNDLESAIVTTLPANSTGYTAIVRGVNNGTGIGVVEAYDLDSTVDSKLANISTRGLVQTGDNVLIAGTIVLGQATQKVIIRALGPSLNVSGKLPDPTLELYDGNGTLIDANDNWVDSPNKQAILDSTIPPPNDNESAIVSNFSGNGAHYTAIVRGVNNTTGVAVVEIYTLN